MRLKKRENNKERKKEYRIKEKSFSGIKKKK